MNMQSPKRFNLQSIWPSTRIAGLAFALLSVTAPLTGCKNTETTQRISDPTWEQSVAVAPEELSKYAGTKKPVRFEVTSGKALYPSQNLAFMNVSSYKKVQIVGDGMVGIFQSVIPKAKVVHFKCGADKIPIVADTYDIDFGCLELYFKNKGAYTSANLPEEAKEHMAKPDEIYQVQGLPANATLSVVAAIENDGEGYKLRPYELDYPKQPNPDGVRRMRTPDHQVEVTSLTMDKLKEYLASHRDSEIPFEGLNHADSILKLPKAE